MKTRVIEVVLEDHTSLGYPMKAEILGRTLFWDEETAWKWIDGYAKKHLPWDLTIEQWNKLSRKEKKKVIADAGAYGIDINKVFIYGYRDG